MWRGLRAGRRERAGDLATKAEIIIPHRYATQLCSAELVAEPVVGAQEGPIKVLLCWVLVKRAAERLSYPVLLLVVWALKREVRAIRGCLGAYRR